MDPDKFLLFTGQNNLFFMILDIFTCFISILHFSSTNAVQYKAIHGQATQSIKYHNSKTEVKSIDVEQYLSLEFEKIS